MKKNFAVEFYVKVGLWSFFCLGLVGVCDLVKAEIMNIEKSGNESIAAQRIQSIRIAQTGYAQKNQGRFAPTFDELVKAGHLNEERLGGQKSAVKGYVFEMKVLEPTGLKPSFYSINADPQTEEDFALLFYEIRARHFFYDSKLEAIKVTEENRQANAADASF